jgi:hypothetical protein
MSAKAQRQALQLLGGGDSPISPEGTCKAQALGDSLYVVFPADLLLQNNVEKGTQLVQGYHAPSNTLLVCPVDAVDDGHWAADFL